MGDTITKCEDCRFAVPHESAGQMTWDFARCAHERGKTDDDGSRWHLGESTEKNSYCSTMRAADYCCGKEAKLFEAREGRDAIRA